MNIFRKIIFYIIRLLILAVCCIIAFVIFFQYNNRLFVTEARLIWPTAKFDENAFRSGTSSVRASMAVDIIENKLFIGASCHSIPESLGEETGDYYNSDSNSTYSLTNKPTANWILTFVCDDNGVIEKVFIRKGCCSVSKKILGWSINIASPVIDWLLK